jgi:Carboxypeptidase regulatory-like domain
MKKLCLTMLLAMVASLSMAALAFCADITGHVLNLQGQPVKGIEILVQVPRQKVVWKVTTNSKGNYIIKDLAPGKYQITLDSLTSGYKGGRFAAYLGANGLTIVWKVSKSSTAVAWAKPREGQAVADSDPFGMSMQTFSYLVGATAIGGGIGGAAAAGAFSGHSHASSPSM